MQNFEYSIPEYLLRTIKLSIHKCCDTTSTNVSSI